MSARRGRPFAANIPAGEWVAEGPVLRTVPLFPGFVPARPRTGSDSEIPEELPDDYGERRAALAPFLRPVLAKKTKAELLELLLAGMDLDSLDDDLEWELVQAWIAAYDAVHGWPVWVIDPQPDDYAGTEWWHGAFYMSAPRKDGTVACVSWEEGYVPGDRKHTHQHQYGKRGLVCAVADRDGWIAMNAAFERWWNDEEQP